MKTIQNSEWRHNNDINDRSAVFIVNCEHSSHYVLILGSHLKWPAVQVSFYRFCSVEDESDLTWPLTQLRLSCRITINSTYFRLFASDYKLFSCELKILNYDEIRSFDWMKLIYLYRLVNNDWLPDSNELKTLEKKINAYTFQQISVRKVLF